MTQAVGPMGPGPRRVERGTNVGYSIPIQANGWQWSTEPEYRVGSFWIRRLPDSKEDLY